MSPLQMFEMMFLWSMNMMCLLGFIVISLELLKILLMSPAAISENPKAMCSAVQAVFEKRAQVITFFIFMFVASSISLKMFGH